MAEIHHMSSLPPDMDNGAAPADGQGGGAGGPKREKRKKKVDTGKLQTLFRSWALQYCSQIAWDTETRAAYAIAGLRNQFGNDEVRMWLQSDKRRVVLAEQVVFDPSNKCGPGCINLYAGLQTVPMQGDCQPILDLLHHLVGGVEDVFRWVLDWIAYPLQNLGAKMPTAVIMHGDEGSGKDTFWAPFLWAICGENMKNRGLMDNDSVNSQWGYQLESEILIINELKEPDAATRRQLANQLKPIIAAPPEMLPINRKGLHPYQMANRLFVLAFSNDPVPISLASQDRRWFCVWSTAPRMDSNKARKMWEWY